MSMEKVSQKQSLANAYGRPSRSVRRRAKITPRLRATSHVVIPARLASTRLPRKLLLSETGKPLIQHTYEAACQASQPARRVRGRRLRGNRHPRCAASAAKCS